MKNTETGEYELVVGNRQLLGGFFIVVLLCGVAFAMGYVVGQNSPRSAKPQLGAALPTTPVPDARPESTTPPAASPAAPQTTAGAGPAGESAPPAEAPPQPTTQPARETPAPATEAPPGSFWQVGAWKQSADAEALLQTLRDGGMPASLRTGTDNLVHLVVGPYTDTQSMGRAKTDLETRFGLHPIRK
jgi:cell division septation protein DedD